MMDYDLKDCIEGEKLRIPLSGSTPHSRYRAIPETGQFAHVIA
jgi:hypothetical protein